MTKSRSSILALDLGTTTGWAHSNKDGAVTSGSVTFKPSRFESQNMRFLKFEKWLDQWPEVEIIFFEEVRRHLGVDAAHAYGGFVATLTTWALKRKRSYSGVPVGTIKKFITGKGNANKEAVIKAVQAKGFSPKDDNEADAIALLLLKLDEGWDNEDKGGILQT